MSIATELLSSIDVYDPDRYASSPPYEDFRQLRQHAPVYRHPHPDGGSFWAVTRHAEVGAVSRDYESYSSQRGFVLIDDLAPDLLQETQHQLLGMDPPQHGPVRRSVMHHFTTRMVAAMTPRIEEIIDGLLGRALAMGECDFIEDVVAPLPTQVVCELMGIPAEHHDQIRHWADLQTAADDPDISDGEQSAREAGYAMGALGYQLAMDSQQRRGGKEGSDLMSLLLATELDGEPVDAMQFASLFIQITVAGNETTRNLIANGLLELMARPDVYRTLEEAPELLPLAIEEMLRFTCPLHYFRRTATRPVMLCGQQIEAGDRVVLFYVSANRDEAVFDDPERFDIRRDPNPQLAFGHGPHMCLGAWLARLETQLFFTEWFRRVAAVESTAAPRRVRSNLINGLKSMPLCITPR